MPLTTSKPRLDYRLAGSAGSPVLFIMGYGVRSAFWKPQVETLSARHRCCTYDHPGVGNSEPGRWLMTTRTLAGHAIRVLDEVDWGTAHIVGVSMGGMVAQELGLMAPERMRSLTLIATHGGALLSRFPTADGFRLFVRATMARKAGARRSALQELLYTREFLDRLPPTVMSERLALAGRPSPRALVGHFTAVTRHRTERRLSRLRVPTLIIRPGRDILVRPSNSDRLHERIQSASLLSFPEAGHGVTFQEAEGVNGALMNHFASADR